MKGNMNGWLDEWMDLGKSFLRPNLFLKMWLTFGTTLTFSKVLNSA